MGKYNKGSNLLIIVGIVGLAVAIIVGIVIWRAILRWYQQLRLCLRHS